MLHKNNLVDIGHIGLPYTQCNRKTNNEAIFERLDRVVANPVWINKLKRSLCEKFTYY